MDWSLLGIEPTTDKDRIADAYHEKLAVTNPEDKPEEFKALRAAYEEALALADTPPADAPATPLDRWLDQVRAVYDDLPARCDTERWRMLLEDPVCFSLGGRLAARDALLHLLMGRSFLPRSVWRLLDEFFDLRDSKEELYEKFPRDFVDYGIINAIQFPELIPYDRFTNTTGAACDAYIPAANRFRRAARHGDVQEAGEAFAALKAIPAEHPFTRYAEALLLNLQDRSDEAMEACNEYLQQCPGDEDGLLLRAQLFQARKDFTAAEADLRAVLAVSPKYNQARYDLVCALESQGRYAAAKEILYELEREQPRNRLLNERCLHINRAFLPELTARYDEDPTDTENALELAWCYLQLGELKRTRQVAEALPREMEGGYEYENLMSKLALNENDNAAAAVHLKKWEQSILALPEGDPNLAKRLARLPEAGRLRAWCLYESGQREEGLALIGQVEQRWPEDAETFLAHAQMLGAVPATATREIHACEQALTRFMELRPSDGYGAFLRGVLRFRQRRNTAAWQDFLTAERCYGRELNCMAYMARILLDDNRPDEARKLLAPLNGVPDTESETLEYCRACLLEQDGKKEQALQKFRLLLDHLRAGSDSLERPGDVYFRCAVLMDDIGNAKAGEMIRMLEEGVQVQPDDLRLMDFLAFEQTCAGDLAAAEATYRRMAVLHPELPGPLNSLGELYRTRRKDYVQAAEWYRRELELRETPAAHSALGKCLQETEDFEGAEREFLAAMRLDPGQPAYPANLAGLYMALNRREEAARLFAQALAIQGASKGFYLSVRRQLARLRTRMGDYGAARALWQQNINAGALEDMTELADLLAHEGRCGDAIALLEEWYAREENASEAWYLRRRARYLRQAGRDNEAKHLLEHCGDSAHALTDLAALHFDRGQVRMALALQKKCVAAAPQEGYQLESLALYQWYAGQNRAAVETARRALALLEQQRGIYERALYHVSRAALLCLTGDYEGARHALAECRKAPQCRDCIYSRCRDADWYEAILLEMLGDYPGAAACVRAGLQAAPGEPDLVAMARRLAKKGENV